VAERKLNKEIASELNLSPYTVENASAKFAGEIESA